MDRLIEQHHQEISRLTVRRGARLVRVFGSMAKDAARSDSDVDILVEMAPGKGAFALGALLLDLEELLGRKVDIVTPAALHTTSRDKVLKESITL